MSHKVIQQEEITQQTKAVLSRHLEVLQTGKMKVKDHYTDESILFTPQGLLKGFEIDQSFLILPPVFHKAFKLLHQSVVGEVAYIVWTAPPFLMMGTETFVIRDQKSCSIPTPPTAITKFLEALRS